MVNDSDCAENSILCLIDLFYSISILFKLPYNKNAERNVEKYLLSSYANTSLSLKHYPPDIQQKHCKNRLHRQNDTNNKKYNRKVTNKPPTKIEPTCNCGAKSEYPLNGNCFQNNIIYQATVK